MSTLTITQDGRSTQFTVPRRRSVRPAAVGRTIVLLLFVLVSLFPFYWIVITDRKSVV